MLRIWAPEIKLRSQAGGEGCGDTESCQVSGVRMVPKGLFLPPFLLPFSACSEPKPRLQRASLGRAGLEEADVSDKAAPSVASFPSQCDWGGVRRGKSGESHLSWLRSSSASPWCIQDICPQPWSKRRVRPKAIPSPHPQCWERKPVQFTKTSVLSIKIEL